MSDPRTRVPPISWVRIAQWVSKVSATRPRLRATDIPPRCVSSISADNARDARNVRRKAAYSPLYRRGENLDNEFRHVCRRMCLRVIDEFLAASTADRWVTGKRYRYRDSRVLAIIRNYILNPLTITRHRRFHRPRTRPHGPIPLLPLVEEMVPISEPVPQLILGIRVVTIDITEDFAILGLCTGCFGRCSGFLTRYDGFGNYNL